MFLDRTVKCYSIISMKKVTEIKSLSGIVYLVGVKQRRLKLFKYKLIILILCNKIPR